MAKSDHSIRDITSMEMSFDDFCEKITCYSVDCLTNAQKAYSECMAVISNSDQETLRDSMYPKYSERFQKLDEQISFLTNSVEHVNTLCQDITAIQEDVKKKLDFESYLGEDLWKLFCSYRREDSYQNTHYISDGLSNSQLIERASELIAAAKKELYKASHMQYNIHASLNNLLVLKEFESLTDDFTCGNWIHMRIDDKLYYLRILSYEINFDNLSTIPIEFSTVEKIWSGISDVESILNSADSIAGSYSATVSQVKNTAAASKYVENWVQKGLDATSTKIVNNAGNQDIVIDGTGICCRRYDDIENNYDPYQIRVISNGLYLLDNENQTVKTGIGKYYYTDPVTNTEQTAYGLIAETIVGKFILGESLGIYDANASMSFDRNGLRITNTENTITIDPNAERLFQIVKGTDSLFYTDKNGNLVVTGTLTAGSGSKIGGWFSTDTALYNGSLTGNNSGDTGLSTVDFTRTINGISRDNLRFAIGSNFGISNTGALYCGNAEMTGSITTFTENKTWNGSQYTTHGRLSGGAINFYNSLSSNERCSLDMQDLRFYGYRFDDKNSYYQTRYSISGLTIQMNNNSTYYAANVFMLSDGILKIYASNGVQIDNIISTHITDLLCFGETNLLCIDKDGNAILNSLRIGDGKIDSSGNATLNTLSASGAIRTYSHGISIYCSPNENAYFNTYWVDGNSHAIVTRGSDGLTTYLGWAGSTNYETVTILRGKSICLRNTSTAVTSDERLKNSFKDLDEFDTVFMQLKPFAFKYNQGTSDRFHFGFGAKQVKESFLAHGFTTNDFAGFVQMKDHPEAEDYCGVEDPMYLRYSEFTAWNTHMIQRLYKENEALKQRITKLEQATA